MAEFHDRMPVILGKGDWPAWLHEEEASNEQFLEMLRPCPDEWLKVWAVDKKVGNVRNKGSELVLPI